MVSLSLVDADLLHYLPFTGIAAEIQATSFDEVTKEAGEFHFLTDDLVI